MLTFDNDFNVAEAGSIPANPNPNGARVQLELFGSNYPKVFTARSMTPDDAPRQRA